MWGVSRVLPDHEYEVDADKAMVRATKKILECPKYEFLLQLKRSIHRRLKTLALPGEILRAGVYPVSAAMVDSVEKTLEDFSVRWGVGVLGLEQVWDLRVREVEDRLRALYDGERIQYRFHKSSLYNRRFEQRKYLKRRLGKELRKLVGTAMGKTQAMFLKHLSAVDEAAIRVRLRIDAREFWRLVRGKKFIEQPPVWIQSTLFDQMEDDDENNT